MPQSLARPHRLGQVFQPQAVFGQAWRGQRAARQPATQRIPHPAGVLGIQKEIDTRLNRLHCRVGFAPALEGAVHLHSGKVRDLYRLLRERGMDDARLEFRQDGLVFAPNAFESMIAVVPIPEEPP